MIDPLERPIGWWLKEADGRIEQAFDAALASSDVDRRRWQVLSSLAHGAADQDAITGALRGFDAPEDLEAVVDDLVQRGLVQRDLDRLRLTPHGLKQHATLSERVQEVRQRVATALPQDDYVMLVRLLARLVDGLGSGPSSYTQATSG